MDLKVKCIVSDDEYNRLVALFEGRKREESRSFGTAGFYLEYLDGIVGLKGLPEMDGPKKKAVMLYLCNMIDYARKAKRVNHKKPSSGSEKYTFRTWLNRIGMTGPGYKEARKLLCENLPGSSSRSKDEV